MTSDAAHGSTVGASPFAPTHWTAVLLAGGETPEAKRALEKLCQVYWPPLYAYIRRQGHAVHEAQDLTQAFIVQLLETRSLAKVEPSKGKFRSFLLASLKHFLANEWDKTQAQKRGGGKVFISLDQMAAETLGEFDIPDGMTPEKIFDRRWAETLLEATLTRLQNDYLADGKKALFEALQATLTADKGSIQYAEIAEQFKTSEGNIRVAVHRLRQRYRELLRTEIAHTVSNEDEVNDELRNLFAALNG